MQISPENRGTQRERYAMLVNSAKQQGINLEAVEGEWFTFAHGTQQAARQEKFGEVYRNLDEKSFKKLENFWNKNNGNGFDGADPTIRESYGGEVGQLICEKLVSNQPDLPLGPNKELSQESAQKIGNGRANCSDPFSLHIGLDLLP